MLVLYHCHRALWGCHYTQHSCGHLQVLIFRLRYSTYLYVLSMPTKTKQQLCIKPTGFLVWRLGRMVLQRTPPPLCLLFLFYLNGFTTGFNPEIQMPYKAIPGSSTAEINAISSTLTCNEQKTSLKECATECYSRRTTQTGCPGFYAGAVQNNVCHLCHVSNYSEVSGNLFTTFSNNDVLYLLATRRVVPEISMDFENKTGNSFQGVGTVGT